MTTIKAEKIELSPIEKLTPNPRNNNRHSIEQLERLAKIIEHRGFREPLTVSKRSGFVVCGHARLEAAKILGMSELPVIYQDFENEAEEYSHMTADNEIARWAELDLHVTYNAIEEFDLSEVEIDLLGIENFSAAGVVDEVNRGDENAEWAASGMPEFEHADKDIKLTIIFATERERAEFSEDHDIEITNRFSGQWTSRR